MDSVATDGYASAPSFGRFDVRGCSSSGSMTIVSPPTNLMPSFDSLKGVSELGEVFGLPSNIFALPENM